MSIILYSVHPQDLNDSIAEPTLGLFWNSFHEYHYFVIFHEFSKIVRCCRI